MRSDDDTSFEDSTQMGVHGKQDLQYMRSLSAAAVHRTPRYMITVVMIIALFVIAAILWMNWARIDVVIRGTGKVSPASQVQNIQSLEGGIIEEILVVEGQAVSAGQSLIKISDIAFTSSFEENRLLYLELLAKSSRLEAEAFGRDFEPDAEVSTDAPQLIKSEKSLFDSNRQQLKETLGILEERINQQLSALREAKSKEKQLKKSLELVKKEIEIKKPLKDRGIISEVEFLQLQQREAEFDGEIEAVRLSVPRIQSTIEEARYSKEKEKLDFQNKAKKELNEVNAEIGRIRETQTALQDRVKRTTLRSPVNGIVQRLYTNTIGGVISPGSNILDIVPQEDSLLVELKIKPADIAYVNVGQFARLKFSAYDFAIHGSLQGIVTFISADTITNDEGESFFLVRVKPSKPFLGVKSGELPIKIGMTAEADILTDKKTILSYLTEPVHRGIDKALRER
ncbi:MAG: HlyD family type I secretion periplasmic adaptor subunit [Gammaproteobacteria bacterium]|nr:HlyD family type I secretion periplasmic adaptor subunit [Gammaproteobacteria bacterium]MDH3448241.1 HlyD family type I secretion periplasmic adaptor subunit [Gammaproteobacteria bacterium]